MSELAGSTTVLFETASNNSGAKGSMSVTVVVESTAGGPPALLASLRVKSLAALAFGRAVFGVNTSASSSPVIAPAVPDSA